MSVQSLAWVFDHAPEHLSHVQRLVLLSIANHADADGDNAWPSLARICREAGVSKRRAQDALRVLEAEGVIARDINEGGTRKTPDDRRPNRYAILAMIEVRGVDAPSTPRGGRNGPTGVDATSTQTVLEPSQGTPPTPKGVGAAGAGVADDSASGDVAAIFEAWKDATKHPRAMLDDARRKKVEERLKDGYSRAELIAAARGIARSDFHMGENDRHQKYDDITIALRDAAHVEKFANLENQSLRRAENLGGKETWMDRSRPIEELT